MNEDIAVLLQVVFAFEQLDVKYCLVGSWASAVFGYRRVTNDVDLVADLKLSQVPVFASALEQDFYLDQGAIREAILKHSSFNLIHLATALKVDVFTIAPDLFARQQMARRVKRRVLPDSEQELYFSSAEDVILAKLRWYRMGGEVSERQWLDVLGVLKVQQPQLDLAYLREWAARLGLHDLLARALQDAFGPD
ncbi:MAG: hypothetical protein ACYC6L_16375 [Anaerolineae bacterium]